MPTVKLTEPFSGEITMKKINSYGEISPLVMKYLKKGVITNCFVSPGAYMHEIAEGRLFCDYSEDFLIFYFLRDDFYIMYFYAANENAVFPHTDKKLICEVSDKNLKAAENNSFKKTVTRVKYELLNNKSTFPSALRDFPSVAPEDVFSLMSKSFDKYTAYLPTYSELCTDCEKKLIIPEFSGDTLSGALRFEQKGKNACIKHLCVDEKFRNAGIGKKLINKFLALSHDKNCFVFTGEENTAARHLYESAGFSLSGEKSFVYERKN